MTQSAKKEQQWNQNSEEAFGREIFELGEKIKAELGPKDLKHLKKIKNISKLSEVIGRTLLHTSLDPITWSAGVIALWVHLQLETTEIGHSALHGCWDKLEGAEKFKSKNFKWKTPIDEKSWQHQHNSLHHGYTNVVGRDPDLNYGSLRVAEQTPWLIGHLTQLTQILWTAPLFTWTIATHASGLTDLTHPENNPFYANILPDRKPKTILKALKTTAKKMIPYSLYQYGLWPILAGPFWLKVLSGNLTAEVLRNIYSIATIYAGHFGDDLEYKDPDFRAHGRGQWFKAQAEATHDFTVPFAFSVLCGALDCQIEHHMFPKLPPNRLREIAPQVESICKKYGVSYNKASWGGSLVKMVKRLAKMSLPENMEFFKPTFSS